LQKLKNILIIKLGYSETLDKILSSSSSLGDVFRTTTLLHFLKGNNISWLVDEKAKPLLENNKYIDQIFTYEKENIEKIKRDCFDILINFEKLPEICSLADTIKAERYFGFTLSGFRNNLANDHASADRLIKVMQNLNVRRENKDCWQDIIVEALGWKWRGEEYILGYKSESRIKYDIGFNWITGSKWTNKAWPIWHWKELEYLIDGRYSISWQEGIGNIHKYIDWINSCKLIVTADTLGLHISLALRKKVVALFGPTSCYEVYFYNRGVSLLPKSSYDCIPCFKPHCDKRIQCMEFIAPEMVMEKICAEFKKDNTSAKV